MPSITYLEPGTDATQDLSLFGGVSTANGTIATDSSQQFTGNRSLKSAVTAAGGLGNVDGLVGVTVCQDAGTRISFYVRFSTVSPALSSAFFSATNGTNAIIAIGLNTNGTLRICGRGCTAVNGSTALSATTWYRLTLSYVITSTSNWSAKLFINGVLEASTGNAQGTLTVVTTSTFTIGLDTPAMSDWNSASHPSIMQVWFDNLYIDNGTGVDDPGDVRVTAKRPNANGTASAFTSQIGSGGSGYGSGHSPQVNEQPLSATNGWSLTNTTKATEEYNVENAATGDVDLTGATILGFMGWLRSQVNSTSNSPVHHIIVDGTATAITEATSAGTFIACKTQASLPAGTGTDIGIDAQYTTTGHLTSLFECGVVVAFTPAVPGGVTYPELERGIRGLHRGLASAA